MNYQNHKHKDEVATYTNKQTWNILSHAIMPIKAGQLWPKYREAHFSIVFIGIRYKSSPIEVVWLWLSLSLTSVSWGANCSWLKGTMPHKVLSPNYTSIENKGSWLDWCYCYIFCQRITFPCHMIKWTCSADLNKPLQLSSFLF